MCWYCNEDLCRNVSLFCFLTSAMLAEARKIILGDRDVCLSEVSYLSRLLSSREQTFCYRIAHFPPPIDMINDQLRGNAVNWSNSFEYLSLPFLPLSLHLSSVTLSCCADVCIFHEILLHPLLFFIKLSTFLFFFFLSSRKKSSFFTFISVTSSTPAALPWTE